MSVPLQTTVIDILRDFRDEDKLVSQGELLTLVEAKLERKLDESEEEHVHAAHKFSDEVFLIEDYAETYSKSKDTEFKDITVDTLYKYMKKYGDKTEKVLIDYVLYNLSDKKCGPRKTKKTHAYTKDELVELAVNAHLLKKTEARKSTVARLCFLLGKGVEPAVPVPPVVPDGVVKECGPRKSKAHPFVYSKDELVNLAIPRKAEFNLTDGQIKRLSKARLCNMLFETGLPVADSSLPDIFSGECEDYTVVQLRHLANKYGVSKNGKKADICQRIEDKIELDRPRNEEELEILRQRSRERKQAEEEEEKKLEEDPCLTVPNKKYSLREHQRKVVLHMLKYRGLIAVHRTGSGKTATAIATMNCILDNYPTVNVIFISPLSLVLNFTKELVKFGYDPEDPRIKKRVRLYSKEEFYSHYKNNKDMKACANSFLIVDEAHNLRGIIKEGGKKPTGAIANTVMKCAQKAFKVLLLTATPMKNRPSDLINLITMVDGISYKEAPNKTYFDKYIMSDDEAFRRYFGCKISMKVKADSDGYPKRIDKPTVKFVMDKRYYKNYLDVQEAQGQKFLINMYGDPSKFKLFYSALRRASLSLDGIESPKVKWTFEKLKHAHESGEKAVAYTAWKASGMNYVRKLLDLAKIPYGMITGDVKRDVREFYKNEYNAGRIKILLLSKAGGEGLDLAETKDIILMESNWNAGDDEQIIGRGIRYKSHDNLPPDERYVNVWRLFTVKPTVLDPLDEQPKSVDEILYDMSYSDKNPIIENTMERLENVSIEAIDCDCYFDTGVTSICRREEFGEPESPSPIPMVYDPAIYSAEDSDDEGEAKYAPVPSVDVVEELKGYDDEDSDEEEERIRKAINAKYVPPESGTALLQPRFSSSDDRSPLLKPKALPALFKPKPTTVIENSEDGERSDSDSDDDEILVAK